MKNLINIGVLAKNGICRNEIENTFTNRKYYSICISESNANTFIQQLNATKLHIGIFNIQYYYNNAMNIIQTIINKSPETKIICIIKDGNNELVENLLKIGVNGIISDITTPSEWIKIIESVLNNHIYLHSYATQTLIENFLSFQEGNGINQKKVEYNLFTKREKQVLELIVQGKANKEIVTTLSLSTATIKGYISNILLKSETTCRTSLVNKAIKNQWVNICKFEMEYVVW